MNLSVFLCFLISPEIKIGAVFSDFQANKQTKIKETDMEEKKGLIILMRPEGGRVRIEHTIMNHVRKI